MNQLIRDLRAHLRADFRPDLYLTTALLLAGLITLNYTLDLEDTYIDSYRGSWQRPVLYILFYASIYYAAMGLWTYFHQRLDIWRNPRFWLHTGVGWVAYGFYAGFYGYNEWSRQLLDGQIYLFAFYCLSNLHSILTLVLPLLLYYIFIDRESSYFYGLKPLGETISSIFGGYLLGVLALYTRSIWGGLLIHLSIAWLMDGVAFLQQWFN